MGRIGEWRHRTFLVSKSKFHQVQLRYVLALAKIITSDVIKLTPRTIKKLKTSGTSVRQLAASWRLRLLTRNLFPADENCSFCTPTRWWTPWCAQSGSSASRRPASWTASLVHRRRPPESSRCTRSAIFSARRGETIHLSNCSRNWKLEDDSPREDLEDSCRWVSSRTAPAWWRERPKSCRRWCACPRCPPPRRRS